ncbi:MULTISPECIES: hypothetical protein [unclassified Mesorhizobium]|uniref:hypothetical protein n=1 Tax=unclassified Mesorhizobium TaxID=325217 RepID=UPI0003D03623|nr:MULTISPECIES: hypothetical protein [unclassified Mesorhizobium]ESZ05409.1 hypothetical protein X736_19800 [Mesorhizobium sp. L2C089B000]WJI49309.1 hypothetical protein NLY44_22030 [Mesorhizobium sp. C089B]
MAKKYTHTECFEHFGTAPRNTYWSWSARNENTKTVAVTLWQHEFVWKGKQPSFERPSLDLEQKVRPGHNELMTNLRWAIDHANGEVQVIIAIAKDKMAQPKTIKECFPSKMVMRVTALDEGTGAFRLEGKQA